MSGKSKKDKPSNELSEVFAKKKNKLTYQLDKIEACSQLLEAKNPFAVEIKNELFFTELMEDFRGLLSRKIMDEAEETSAIFTKEEIKTLKALSKRVSEQPKPQKPSLKKKPVPSKKVKEPEEKKEKSLVSNLDFIDGDTLIVKGNTVFESEEGKSFLKSGDQVTFLNISETDNNRIVVLNEDGAEGTIILNSAERI